MPYEFPSQLVESLNDADVLRHEREQIVTTKAAAATAAARALEVAKRNVERTTRDMRLLYELMIIERGLPPQVMALMEQIAVHDREINDIDRTGRQQTESRRLAKEARAELRKICPHSFLYHQHRQSPHDPDDVSSPGEMLCMVCDFSEREGHWQHSHDSERYTVTNDPDRLYTHYLGPKTEFSRLHRPVPWEMIRGFFLVKTHYDLAKAIGYVLK